MKKILIINLAGIGDLLLSTPALRGLRSLYPQAEINMLVIPRSLEVAEGLPYIDKTFVFNMGSGGAVPLAKIFNNIRVLYILRRERFDLAINMRTLVSEKSARKVKFLLDVINPVKTAGRDTEGRGYFFDVRIPETEKGKKYEMEYDIDTVRTLGAEVIDKSIDFRIDEESAGRVDKILENEGISGNDMLVGVHAGGTPSRRWPVDNFSEAMRGIREKVSCKFVLTGGKDEAGLVKRLEGKDVINLAGRLNIKELGALIKRCSLFISNDTGPMHIAAILRTPLVAIFGPGHLVRFDPRKISDKAQVLYKKAPCAPCEKAVCEDPICLKVISSEEVIEAALRFLR